MIVTKIKELSLILVQSINHPQSKTLVSIYMPHYTVPKHTENIQHMQRFLFRKYHYSFLCLSTLTKANLLMRKLFINNFFKVHVYIYKFSCPDIDQRDLQERDSPSSGEQQSDKNFNSYSTRATAGHCGKPCIQASGLWKSWPSISWNQL